MANFYIPISRDQLAIVRAVDADEAYAICRLYSPFKHGRRESVEQTTRRPTLGVTLESFS